MTIIAGMPFIADYLVTRRDAMRIIRAQTDAPVRFSSKRYGLLIRPSMDPRGSLAWIALDSGADSAIRIHQTVI